MKYTVNGYNENGLVESHDTNEICAAYEFYRHLNTQKGEIVDNTYSEIFESYGFDEQFIQGAEIRSLKKCLTYDHKYDIIIGELCGRRGYKRQCRERAAICLTCLLRFFKVVSVYMQFAQ